MNNKIIRPEGKDLLYYLNNGYAICNKCGAVMDLFTKGDYNYYICPSCGGKTDSSDYEYENETDNEWSPDMIRMFGNDIPPEGCFNCGGPYPHCKLSCKLFDD